MYVIHNVLALGTMVRTLYSTSCEQIYVSASMKSVQTLVSRILRASNFTLPSEGVWLLISSGDLQ